MKVNRGDFEGASEQFLVWTKAGGKVLKGLVTRRTDEQALFNS
jgi:lysozyme